MKPFQQTLLIFLLALLLPAQLMAVAPLSANKRYLSRDVVDSPATGVSFLLPRHFRGSYDVLTGLFFMKNREGLLIGVFGFSHATLDDINGAALAAAKKMGIQLTLQKKEHLDQHTTRSHFSTQSANGPGLMIGIAERGKAGNALAMMVFGKPEQEEQITKKVMRVMARVEWREPATQNKAQTLAGMMLTNDGGQAQIAFCKDGRFRSRMNITSLFSTGSTSAQKSGTNIDPGTWRRTTNLVGDTLLVLRTADGEFLQWPIQVTEDGVKINGRAYLLRPAKTCP